MEFLLRSLQLNSRVGGHVAEVIDAVAGSSRGGDGVVAADC